MNIHCAKALMGFDYELYEAPDKKFGSMSEVVIYIYSLPSIMNLKTRDGCIMQQSSNHCNVLVNG